MLTALTILVDGLVYSSWLFIVAVGLTLIFGVMKVLNVAHGGFYSIGAYAAAWSIGLYFQAGFAPLGAYALLILSAIVSGAIVGFVLERGLLRFVYGRDEVLVVLVTYAVFLILENLVLQIWGVDAYLAYQPDSGLGVTKLDGLAFSNYELALIPTAGLIGFGLWWGLNRTRAGKVLRAVIHDREMALAFGIDVQRLFTVTFVIGAILGAFGGAVTAPMISVTPGIGVEVIVLAFAVVVISGLGSVPGTMVGALIVGLCRAAAVHLLPQVELFVIYAVMSVVLIVRPQGLFGTSQPRRI
ncbi:MAG TPA: branched-chain amino acid ABC transporter permease [Alphaproteobacteria bacterium]|nr:branched-chain amino acid ABC transporter permease [Alphaproteobacteria bacterium]